MQTIGSSSSQYDYFLFDPPSCAQVPSCAGGHWIDYVMPLGMLFHKQDTQAGHTNDTLPVVEGVQVYFNACVDATRLLQRMVDKIETKSL